jgi:hypothetical protein
MCFKSYRRAPGPIGANRHVQPPDGEILATAVSQAAPAGAQIQLWNHMRESQSV